MVWYIEFISEMVLKALFSQYVLISVSTLRCMRSETNFILLISLLINVKSMLPQAAYTSPIMPNNSFLALNKFDLSQKHVLN